MIGNRLKRIFSLIDDDCKMIDIGCDHALLDIYIAKHKKVSKIIASDINEGPLKQAQKNISKQDLEKKIIIKLGNGLEIIEKDIDTVVIAGLGGNSIVNILDCNYLKDVNTLILEPNNNESMVRYHINKLGYKIVHESLVLEKDILYLVIKATRGIEKLSNSEIMYGTKLIKKDILYRKYLNNYLKKLNNMLLQIPKKYIVKRFKIKKEIIDIKNIR